MLIIQNCLRQTAIIKQILEQLAAIFCGSARLETRHHHFLCNSETGERRKSNRAREGENSIRTEGRDEGREKDRKVRERAEERDWESEKREKREKREG